MKLKEMNGKTKVYGIIMGLLITISSVVGLNLDDIIISLDKAAKKIERVNRILKTAQDERRKEVRKQVEGIPKK